MYLQLVGRIAARKFVLEAKRLVIAAHCFPQVHYERRRVFAACRRLIAAMQSCRWSASSRNVLAIDVYLQRVCAIAVRSCILEGRRLAIAACRRVDSKLLINPQVHNCEILTL